MNPAAIATAHAILAALTPTPVPTVTPTAIYEYRIVTCGTTEAANLAKEGWRLVAVATDNFAGSSMRPSCFMERRVR